MHKTEARLSQKMGIVKGVALRAELCVADDIIDRQREMANEKLITK
jgi:hypothetical protein